MSLRTIHYILDPEIGNGHVPIDCDDDEVWNAWMVMSHDACRVARDRVGTILLSTVFLSLDHRFGEGPPMLFETMAFDESDREMLTLGDRTWESMGAEVDQLFERYSTWESAEIGHGEKLVKLKEMVEQ